jgi:hypothetical protein
VEDNPQENSVTFYFADVYGANIRDGAEPKERKSWELLSDILSCGFSVSLDVLGEEVAKDIWDSYGQQTLHLKLPTFYSATFDLNVVSCREMVVCCTLIRLIQEAPESVKSYFNLKEIYPEADKWINLVLAGQMIGENTRHSVGHPYGMWIQHKSGQEWIAETNTLFPCHTKFPYYRGYKDADSPYEGYDASCLLASIWRLAVPHVDVRMNPTRLLDALKYHAWSCEEGWKEVVAANPTEFY